VYSVWAFRAAPDDETDGPPIHGNAALEVGWTAIPAVLVIAVGIVSAVVLHRNADAGTNPVTIKVYAQQFAWYFEYPDAGGARSEELVLPVDKAIRFEMKSADVIHSFWIPEMGQKQDLVPGLINKIVVTPTRTGDFTLICTELCGLGHATMRAPVRVLTQAKYATWLAELKSGSTGGSAAGGTDTGGEKPEQAGGAKVFASAGCGGCHAFTPAGTTTEIGPSLDNLAADAQKAGEPLSGYVRESIVDPGAVVVAGYQDGVMPTTFGDTLRPAELDQLVQYLTGEEAS
jgi:cytochrome c oxidase subunit 2